MESTKLESVMLKLNPNKSIMLEFMPTDTTVMLFQRYTTPSLEFTLSASAKLILTLTPKWFTPLLSVDTHGPTLLLSVTFTTLVSMGLLIQPCPVTLMESSHLIQKLIILDTLATVFSSVKQNLKLIPNGYTTMLTPHMLDTLDTTPSVDTPLLITTATSGTELNTCGNYGLKRTNCLPEK